MGFFFVVFIFQFLRLGVKMEGKTRSKKKKEEDKRKRKKSQKNGGEKECLGWCLQKMERVGDGVGSVCLRE